MSHRVSMGLGILLAVLAGFIISTTYGFMCCLWVLLIQLTVGGIYFTHRNFRADELEPFAIFSFAFLLAVIAGLAGEPTVIGYLAPN